MNNIEMKIRFCIFFILLCKIAISQVIELTGIILIGSSEAVKYQLVYEIKSNNLISGYSVSDAHGSSETRAKISGTYNSRKGTLDFEEMKILSTKTKLLPDDFCLMKVRGKFEKKAGKNILTGTFDSKSTNQKLICSSGTVLLATSEDVNKFLRSLSSASGRGPAADSLNKGVNENLQLLLGVDKVKSLQPESMTEFTLVSDSVQMDVLDDRLEDGDRITIIKNKTTVVSDMLITNKVQTLRFFIDKKDPLVVFTIIACNEGMSPPNTVKMILRNGNDQQLLIAELKKGQMVRLLLRRNGE